MKTSRRTFLVGTSAVATSALATPFSALAVQKTAKKAVKKEEPEEDVSTNEDLMREHGVLNRILLIYDEAIRRIQGNENSIRRCSSNPLGLSRASLRTITKSWKNSTFFRALSRPASWWS